jgi:hypothetical protein
VADNSFRNEFFSEFTISWSTAVRLLAPHLKDEDHLALLGGAIHKSKRQIVELLAGKFPSADVPASIRKLPAKVPATPPAIAAPSAAA